MKVNTLLATISSLEMNLDTTKAECQRQTSELQASKTELGHLKLHLADKVGPGELLGLHNLIFVTQVKESSEIQTGSKKGYKIYFKQASLNSMLSLSYCEFSPFTFSSLISLSPSLFPPPQRQSLFARLSARSPQVIITLELEPTDQGLGIKVANAPPEVGGCIVKGTAPYCQTDQLRHGDK